MEAQRSTPRHSPAASFMRWIAVNLFMLSLILVGADSFLLVSRI